jgi:hypothetical protein
MYLRLPNRILIVRKIDFSAIRIVLEDAPPDVKITSLRPINPKDFPRLGLSPYGYLGSMNEIMPLDACIKRAITVYQNVYPLALTGAWYLTTSGPWGSILTNGQYAMKAGVKTLNIMQLRSKPKAVRLDPVGIGALSRRGIKALVNIVFPLAHVVQLINKHEAKLADPYAWTKHFVPHPYEKGTYVEVLVLGGKE